MGDSVKYGCRCGETVFDLAGRATGDVLTCPFCKRQYFHWGGGHAELLDQPIDTSSPNAYFGDLKDALKRDEAAPKTKEEDSKAFAGHDSAEPSKDDGGKHAPDGPKRRRFHEILREQEPERLRAAPKPEAPSPSSRGNTAADVPPAPPSKLKKLFFLPDKPIPGGMTAMVAFIVSGNVAAFIAMAVLWPSNPDGTRMTSFGLVPKSAIWPELSAIVMGHVIGFAVWMVYVETWLRKHRADAQAQQLAKNPPK